MAPLLVMHQLTSEVSHKNIPTPNTVEHEKQMVQKGESFMMRLHWKTFWVDNKTPLPYKTTEQRGQGISEHFFTTS